MTPIALRLVVLPARTPVQIDQAVVVPSGDQSLILAHVDDVDVASIGARRVDTLNEPAKLDRVVLPNSRSCRGGSTWLLSLGFRVEEEQLIRTTRASNPVAVDGPVECRDVA